MAMAILSALPELRHRPVTSGTDRGRSRHGTTSVTKHWHRRNVGRLVLAAWSKRSATPGRTARRQRVIDHDQAAFRSDLTSDDPAHRQYQAEQPEPFEHPVCQLSRGVSARIACVTSDASTAPTISSKSVSRAASGLDCTISPTHRQRVAGNRGAVPWRLRVFVWVHTRYMATCLPAIPSSETLIDLQRSAGLETPVTFYDRMSEE